MTNEKETRPPTVVARLTGLSGMLWFGGWLFTVGFAQPVWWKIVLGVVMWPYILGRAIH